VLPVDRVATPSVDELLQDKYNRTVAIGMTVAITADVLTAVACWVMVMKL